MMNNKNLYTKDSIESLDPRSFTRLKPGVYAGSTEYSTQLLVEIVSNAIDEFRLGHGNRIDVTINKDIFRNLKTTNSIKSQYKHKYFSYCQL